ncbi:MAG: UDP-N-acetylglucosamine--LPS N-acetylglucosamine transferase [Acidobacteria bacterium]|nr:UDP-N-acetylglucosamine--LPS N-acetylglucosamine transferase [Acidobacteriota bacterium]
MRVCLVCSTGGHLLELFRMRSAWEQSDCFWVTFDGPDSRCLLRDEQVVFAYCPTNRNLINLIRNTWVAIRTLKRQHPDVILTTGAGIALPFAYVGKLMGIPTVYVESYTRISGFSLTGKLIYPIAEHFLVQWPELAEQYRKAEFGGQVI